MDFVQQLRQAAEQEGFSRLGVCRADAPADFERFAEWLEAGYAGEMSYLETRRDAYRDPNRVLEGVRSIVMLTMNYANETPAWLAEKDVEEAAPGGRVSRYAWGERDYHDVIHERLKRLKRFILAAHPQATVRGVVDTAPLLERDYARLAGLGWIGKNTMLIHRKEGSWFFLAALLTDLELPSDAAYETDHCGVCRACLDACPTNAFPEPYQLDATRCISYLTIELRGSIPEPLREGVGEWLFGCDVCQEVCPWNRRPAEATVETFQPRSDLHMVDLPSLFELNDEQFRERFRRTPLWRAKREGILRNAAIVLGNQGDVGSLPALQRALNDSSEIVREAASWAIERIRRRDASADEN